MSLTGFPPGNVEPALAAGFNFPPVLLQPSRLSSGEAAGQETFPSLRAAGRGAGRGCRQGTRGGLRAHPSPSRVRERIP